MEVGLMPGAARPIDVNEAKFRTYMGDSGLVLVKFGAPWCPPCRLVDAELDQLAARNAERLTVLRVDVDESPRLANRYQIESIPRLMLFLDGKKIEDWTGFQSTREMQSAVDAAEESAAPAAGELQINPYSG